MARQLTYEDFNTPERFIIGKLEIFFDGPSQPPVTISRSDYLVDFTILEETGAETENPMGAVSANELTFTLFNPNRIFSPSNQDSPYYGKINVNVQVKAYINVELENDETEWLGLGYYFVDTWETAIGDSVVSVACTDRLRPILEQPMPALSVNLNETYAAFFRRVFNALGVPDEDLLIDSTLTKLMKFSYNNDGLVIDTLQPLLEAALAYVYVTRDNKIRVIDMLTVTTPVTRFADTNQVIAVDIPQSILKTYSSIELNYSMPNISDDISVLRIAGASFVAGGGQLSRYKVSQGPVFLYSYFTTIGTLYSSITDIHATSWEVSLDTQNESGAPETGEVEVYARVVFTNQTTIEEANAAAVAQIGIKPFSITNYYIQDNVYARQYAEVMVRFITNDVPVLAADCRGNPLVVLGDIILVDDATHEVEYTTKVVRAEYRYDGGLTCNYTFLNTEILGGGN